MLLSGELVWYVGAEDEADARVATRLRDATLHLVPADFQDPHTVQSESRYEVLNGSTTMLDSWSSSATYQSPSVTPHIGDKGTIHLHGRHPTVGSQSQLDRRQAIRSDTLL